MATAAEDAAALEEGAASTDEASTDFLNMSDEDFEKALMEDFAEEAPSAATEEIAVEEEPTEAETEETETVETTTEEVVEEEETVTTEETEEVTTDVTEETTDPEKAETQEEAEPLSADDTVKAIFAPFKANGKEMKVESVDDVRQLMQMGANYNKKMAAIKPNLKLMKMLQNNDLLDESKLSYLIDLDKKNPDAIKKLLKDSKIDVDNLDIEDELNYKPNTYTVNDKEIELDETLNDIRDTKSFATTLDIIGNKWDSSSRSAILENPAAIRVLNDHVSSGIFDKINAAVETERMFNRIPLSMSDIEAYKHVGDMINARGGFNNTPQSAPITRPVVKPKKTVDPALANRKNAASSTKSAPRSAQKETLNPLAMSDEEFEKVGIEKFI